MGSPREELWTHIILNRRVDSLTTALAGPHPVFC
jgi:hypothetical protein